MCEEKNPAEQPSVDQALSAPRPRWDGWKAVLFTLALLAAVTVQTVQCSLVLLALALVLSLGRRPIALLGERFCLPVVGFLAFTAATLSLQSTDTQKRWLPVLTNRDVSL